MPDNNYKLKTFIVGAVLAIISAIIMTVVIMYVSDNPVAILIMSLAAILVISGACAFTYDKLNPRVEVPKIK